MRLGLHRTNDNVIELRFPLLFRVFFAVIALVIIAAILATSPQVFSQANILPLIFFVVALIGMLYDERWVFKGESFTSLSGFLFAHARRLRNTSEIESVRLERYIRGQPPQSIQRRSVFFRPTLNLLIHLKDGEILRIETYRHIDREKAGDIAREIAAFCGVPYSEPESGSE
jgi:hypothetical protein